MVKIVEVGLRDGLQNEAEVLPTTVKIELIRRLIAAKLTHLEVTSFVHPKWIPQLADADQLLLQLPIEKQINYRALVPNLRGWERVKTPPLHEIAVFISASETHNQKNVNSTIQESMHQIRQVIASAKLQSVPVRGYLSCVFGCPYEGTIAFSAVEKMCNFLFECGVYEVSLGDTIGVATPKQVQLILRHLQPTYAGKLAVHFHDTKGLALANTYVALEEGVTTIDSSIGGLGGCPYAPGASGNVATEEVVNLLHGLGIKTEFDLDELCEIASWLQQIFQKSLPSKMLKNYLAKKEVGGL
ncbi:hydroxymethylglutaryl-CoA lyase [Shimazuella kribbensis]|uniref:hydroxymethylglutaryl-CoA lyase n=1 Tax=Shimazuella kribbensis TaxID=139808 RepID=UPI000422BDD7